MKNKKLAVAVGLTATIALGGFGIKSYATAPEIKTDQLKLAYGEELKTSQIKTSDDVVKTSFKTKVDNKKLGKQTVKVEVQNKRGFNSEKDITVTVEDKSAPVIEVANELTAEVGQEFNIKEQIKVNDNVDGNLIEKLGVSEFKTDSVKDEKVKLTVEDSSKNKAEKEITLHVKDTGKPELNAENKSITLGSEFNPLDGVSANDKVDGDLTGKIEVDNKVDVNKAGTYEVIYKVKDNSNNEENKTVTVEVKEQQKAQPVENTEKEQPKAETVNNSNKEEAKPVSGKPQVKQESKQQESKPQPKQEVKKQPVQEQQAKPEQPKQQQQQVAQQPKAQPQPEQPKKEVQQPSKQYAPMTIYFNGKAVKYANGGTGSGQSIIDGNYSKASTWGGASFNGNDGMNTHFIGHNPGAFTGIWNAGSFIITDGNGNPTKYNTSRVYKVYQKGAKGVADGVSYWDRITGTGGGERVTFQTCVSANSSAVDYIVEAVKVG